MQRKAAPRAGDAGGGETESRSAAAASRSGSLVAGMFNMIKRRATRTGASAARTPVDEEMAGSRDRTADQDGEIFCENPDEEVQLALDSLEDDAREFDLPTAASSSAGSSSPEKMQTKQRHSLRMSKRMSLRSSSSSASSMSSSSSASPSAIATSTSSAGFAAATAATKAGSRISVKRVEDFPSVRSSSSSRDVVRVGKSAPVNSTEQDASVLRRLSQSLSRRSSSSRRSESRRKSSLRISQDLKPASERELAGRLDAWKGKRISTRGWSQSRKSGRSARKASNPLVAQSETSADVVIRTDEDLDTLCEAIEAGEAHSLRFASASPAVLEGFASVLGTVQIEGLHTLDLSGAQGAESMEKLLDALGDGTGETLEELNASRTSVCHVFDQFALVLECMPALRDLTLRMCLLSPSQVNTLSSALLGMDQLECLDLSGNELTEDCIGDLVRNLQTVEILRVRACGIDDAGMASMCAGLKKNEVMSTLDLSGNPFSSGACQALARLLGSSTSALAHLDLSYTGIDEDGVAMLCGALTKSRSQLQSLDLRSCALGVEGCFALGEALESNETLETLTVGGPLLPPHTTHGVCDEGVARLIEMLRANEGLTMLTIAEGCVSADAQYVVSQLASTPVEDRTARLAEMFLVDKDEGATLSVLGAAGRASVRRLSRGASSLISEDDCVDGQALTDMAFTMSVGEAAVHAACMAWLQEAGHKVSKFPTLGVALDRGEAAEDEGY
ncbi:NACHT, LRR and PYD domains-containing protein 12 [Hondaea fermentalgiana]|uniref:NACHT, LRR and PYD domains-containing protein 12 n=1 Tax=Hondaea fermentalgiana TaxID=2315210 RepID=A0A2R5GJH0_9STRA|nr:NACHT, LRR and PYD domains-containing protein 12 [Hondaea fermentalgiana]|eukprot:GBG31027.1 NACHT, LRR and PYD domains-containing protein 12 [Hondaea fermentalgiana]